jgi:ubiquinone/menaquinone biosynthesis C-methylase UbiE/uncharacterized protein YbaR (Trm112 family)
MSMRRCLVAKLACPECRGNVEVAEVFEQTNLRILRGTLRCCFCSQCYPIDKGVPRLVKVAADIAEVCRRYSFQWLSRWNGKFEGKRCYGFDDDIYIDWVKTKLECRRVPAPDNWLLDAGCGSGEKTQVLARKYPRQNVVGLDLGVEPLEKAAAAFGHMTNLDYVQGNILEPPFKDHQFDAGISLGVLHHTDNTRQALARFRRLLKAETTCVIWIYPTYREGPEWRVPYLVRDLLTGGQGYRMPTGLLRLIAHSIVIVYYPIAQFCFWKSYRRIGRDLPFFRVEAMTLRERYKAQVFFCFDTLLPRYQWRHKAKEVEGWLVEEGLDPLLRVHSFYAASSVPVT